MFVLAVVWMHLLFIHCPHISRVFTVYCLLFSNQSSSWKISFPPVRGCIQNTFQFPSDIEIESKRRGRQRVQWTWCIHAHIVHHNRSMCIHLSWQANSAGKAVS